MTRTNSDLALYIGFCVAVRALTHRRRISVVSWWRTPAHNSDRGGLANSRHLDGIGADAVLDPGEDRDGTIQDARQLGLQVVDEGDHIHFELDPL